MTARSLIRRAALSLALVALLAVPVRAEYDPPPDGLDPMAFLKPVGSWLRRVVVDHEVYLGRGVSIVFRGVQVTVERGRLSPLREGAR